ncbi:phage shock protein PspC (stress-responsive transcriptional regulator) [Bacillus mesophilus]|uniref:PspC domain-containing protein n=1 Tax=Bacillus mesophilus TaxID=1808955 RepID=A0A6M0Q779_9BACI|nr:PspC domain-containing protein [Bacillus mesophilus]MBM7661547.1 phage shock protein PspC (stress-responsive transcriptional regulator) [Bacillus mesophilus]NEY72216.1 PspC domain-containing protein [Bacillus mesophilus]
MTKLTRSRSDRKLAGVIGGLAQYTGFDVSLLRVLFVVGLIMSFGTFALIYLIWMFVVPNSTDVISR